ncbi:MBL fold metallo-hydrolase [Gordonia jinhuaensis]|uniref:MBL fold metallo-hydrolase n=1 Tax=Gordonia jinhuaensis TaxID=1517702 RepID=A0A916TCN5_9ACTN|nr:MBL fold metallo-hydrolase [Gordonia jinhuaensis]GGB38601.1 MBL fold metallo-hydrolase [Gordonia jinhuaensis]
MNDWQVTGDAQRAAWADKRLPEVEQVRPGLWSIPVAMTGNPLRYVLIYALEVPDGVALIDTGWPSRAAWTALQDGLRAIGYDVSQIRHIAITHFHPDHFGLVPRVLEHTDATVAMHRNDSREIDHRTDAEEELEKSQLADQLLAYGAPVDEVSSLRGGLVRFAGGRTVDTELVDGSDVGFPGWHLKAVWTPGHTPGHLCFLDEQAGVLFSGDHLLPRISPNISVMPLQTGHHPLGEYLLSLQNSVDIPDVEVLPSHEYRFTGIASRATELLAHHEARLEEMTQAIVERPGRTTWDVAAAVHWSRPFDGMGVNQRRMAATETHAHVLVLVERGIVRADTTTPMLRWYPNTATASSEPGQPADAHSSDATSADRVRA